MRWSERLLISVVVLLQGVSSFLGAGESVPNLDDDQKLERSAVDGYFGRELDARGRRTGIGWSGLDGGVFFYWSAWIGQWAEVTPFAPYRGGISFDDGELVVSGNNSGATVRLFDDDTGEVTTLAGIPHKFAPSAVAISFPHAALVYPEFGLHGVVVLYRYDSQSSTWGAVDSLDGSAVALDSRDLVIGIPEVGVGNGQVRYYEYDHVDEEWQLQQTLVGQDPLGEFGATVALSDRWLAVGVPAEDTSFPQPLATDIGAVHLFKKSGNQFSSTASLFGLRDFDRFGTSVEIQDRTLAVGSPYEDIVAGQFIFPNVGAVYVYWRHGELWGTTARLRASDWASNVSLGLSVAISDQGILAGAPYAEGPAGEHDAGAVYFWNHTTAIFADGFETGDVFQWSASEL